MADDRYEVIDVDPELQDIVLQTTSFINGMALEGKVEQLDWLVFYLNQLNAKAQLTRNRVRANWHRRHPVRG